MPVKVIDASALAAVMFDEPDSDGVISAIGRSSLVAPYLMEFEVASVCAKKIRAHPNQQSFLLAAFALMERLDIEVAPVDLSAVIELAQDTRVTVYDACYLWLARTLKCQLLTLDKRLAAAHRRRT